MFSKKVCSKIVFFVLSLMLVVGALLPNYVNAASLDSNQKRKQPALTQTLINKVNDYIKVEDKQFKIINGKKLEKEIGKEKFDAVKNHVMAVNELLHKSENLVVNEKTITQTIDEDNTGTKSYVKDGPDRTNACVCGAGGSSFMDIDYTWWGAQIFFSHRAVVAFNDYFFAGSFIGALGAKQGFKDFLAKHGYSISSKYLGPIALYGSGMAWAMGKIDNGYGVNVNCVLYIPATITAV